MTETTPVKAILIIVKCVLVTVFMIIGMRSYYTRSNRINSVFKLFCFYITILLLLCVYEFLFPLIPFLYVILVFSGMGKLAGVQIFIEKAKHF